MAGLVVPPWFAACLAARAFVTGGGVLSPDRPNNGGNRRRLLAHRAFGTLLRGHLGTVPGPSFTDTARWGTEGRSYPSSSLQGILFWRMTAGFYCA